MIIDFSKIEEERIVGFKGGQGELFTRNYADDKCKIMKSRLRPGASSGLHTHVGNCEIVFVLSGTGYFEYDGERERVKAGDVHYCPMNHSHFMVNDGDTDMEYLAIVAEHH